MGSLTLKFDQHPEAEGRIKDAIDAGDRDEVARLIAGVFESTATIKIKYSTTHTTELLPRPKQPGLFDTTVRLDVHRN